MALCLWICAAVHAQPGSERADLSATVSSWTGAAFEPAMIAPAPHPYNESRILGVIPDYQTVTEGHERVAPLTRKQKWGLALKETVDPFNIVNSGLTAAFSQMGDQTPKYGEGGAAYGKRFGAAIADFGTQNLFSAGVVASLLHQDPRYFRRGSECGIARRVLYSVSRVVVARQDSGRTTFNASGILGMAMGIAASNLYYPSASIRGEVMAARVETSIFGSVTGNLMSEFWPDIQKKFFHHHQ
jgi:hypothetical protein